MDLFTLDNLIALITLAGLEIILGIDNIVMLSILSNRLPVEKRHRARKIGLLLAMIMRILLLCSLSFIMKLTEPLFTIFTVEISGRSLILIVGGLFLLYKATKEIHEHSNDEHEEHEKISRAASFAKVLIQIMLFDLVFSLDSVITAVGMAQNLIIMIVAIVIAILVMMQFSGQVSKFIDHNPSIKILALCFLNLIGFMLVMEGVGKHIEKGYIYSAIGFSLVAELINIKKTKSKRPQH